MDVIDLCMDDSPEKRPKATSTLKSSVKSASGSNKSTDTPRVPPIRVVNLASLQNIKIVRPEPIRQSRRKSTHHIKNNSDTNVEIIETKTVVASNKANKKFPTTSSILNSVQVQQSNGGKIVTKLKFQRPNYELMRRVSFLRVCAEYMLKELGINNVNLGENQSIVMLKSQYLQNKNK